jgi:hypothetical protein
MPFTPETAPPETLIQAFVELLPPERFVFSPQDSPALYELIDNLPDEPQAIAEEIKKWCQERRKVYNSLKSALSKRGVLDYIPAAKPEDDKTLLKNKLRESFPEPPQEPPQKPPAPKK